MYVRVCVGWGRLVEMFSVCLLTVCERVWVCMCVYACVQNHAPTKPATQAVKLLCVCVCMCKLGARTTQFYDVFDVGAEWRVCAVRAFELLLVLPALMCGRGGRGAECIATTVQRLRIRNEWGPALIRQATRKETRTRTYTQAHTGTELGQNSVKCSGLYAPANST